MITILVTEDGDEIHVSGSVEAIEMELVRVGLVSDSTDDYNTPKEFFEANDINFSSPKEPEVLSVEELVGRWY